MVYKAIGIMSGSSLDGLDLAYVHFQEKGGQWSFEIQHAACYQYNDDWTKRLQSATTLAALDYQLLHTAFGHLVGERVNQFIDAFSLHHRVDLVASHGHTTFHLPEQKMTGQLGDGAAIAAVTGLPVVSDLRAMDIALGGQGAPIVPIGEKLLLGEYNFLLNLGGIANVSARTDQGYIAFDICPANRVMNLLVQKLGRDYDANGELAASGQLNEDLLESLGKLGYYGLVYPKSLANGFGNEQVFPLVERAGLSTEDALNTYVTHIAIEVRRSISGILEKAVVNPLGNPLRLLVTGGGAHNGYLVKSIAASLLPLGIELVVPHAMLIDYKEALIMGLIGVLRWREEYNVLSSVTGASRNSIGGALWLGGEA